jgi:hypothetical protein
MEAQGRWPPRLTALGITVAAVEASAAQLERETFGAIARVAVGDAMNQAPSGEPHPGGRPTRHDEIRAAYDALPKVRRLKLLAESKKALYAELRRIIVDKTSLSHSLGDKAMAAALEGKV